MNKLTEKFKIYLMLDLVKCVMGSRYYILKIKYYLDSNNYHDLCKFINQTAWFAKSSALRYALAILEERIQFLNKKIWATPTIAPKNRLSMKFEEYSLTRYTIDLGKESLDDFGPNPQYHILIFQKKRLDLAMKTIRANV
ncbi:MAG: hypothetical protein AAGA10_04540 [Bacteroidota bacterium]